MTEILDVAEPTDGARQSPEALASALEARLGEAAAPAILEAAIHTHFRGEIALVSSFGIEAAVLLDLLAETDAATPVLFLDTEKLFPETLRYRDKLIAYLGLTDVRVIRPDSQEVAHTDPDGQLWARNPDQCCGLRKVAPLGRALTGFNAWLTGRKRYQGGQRKNLPVFEAVDGRVKVNPLARWTPEDVRRRFLLRDLPRHPMSKVGYRSIGCVPCSAPASESDGDNPRAGRWQGTDKTECGIHFSFASALPTSSQNGT